MLRVLGSRRKLCDRVTRRELLRAGALSAGGLTLDHLLRAHDAQAAEQAARPSHGFGQAKSCIILFLYGAPSQLELYDPKPDAPIEIRGEFETIDTRVPGAQIIEHLPRIADVLDRATVVRSLTHPYNIHSVAYSLTGIGHVDIPMELGPHDNRHWPFIGSVLDYLEQSARPNMPPPPVPRDIALPFPFSSRCAEFDRAGPYAAFLGQGFNPVWTEFVGDATRTVKRWRSDRDQEIAEPFAAIDPAGRFVLAEGSELPAEITLDRLANRRTLLEQFDDERRGRLDPQFSRAHDRFQQMAYSLIGSQGMRQALDLEREPMELRERYGMNLFGQATLAARRLVEAGARLVTVFWDEIGTANSAWDTHFNHFARLKNELLPGLDHAFSSLVLDLEQRGLLDETVVACIGEHGRTPKISDSRGAGREHWSRAYCGLFAGGGIAPGRVVGRTDRHGGDVAQRPVSPKDVLATLYHLLGVDPTTTIPDRLGRPLPLVAEGHVVDEMIA